MFKKINYKALLYAFCLLMSWSAPATNIFNVFRPWHWRPETKSYVKKGLVLGTMLNDKQAPHHIRHLCGALQYYISLAEILGWCPTVTGHSGEDYRDKMESYLHTTAVISNTARYGYGLWLRRADFNS